VVGLLFTDIEGSTGLARRLGVQWGGVQARHHEILRESIDEHGGWVDGVEGDAFFATFAEWRSAALAAVAAQRRLHAETWPVDVGDLRVRMGVHVGAVDRTEVGYVGLDIHLAARVAGAAHGGQVLMTLPARRAVEDVIEIEDLGLHRLRDFPRAEHLFCAVVDGQGADAFPPPRTLDVRPTNLPTAPVLIGRDSEVKALVELLDGSEARLVTVTGRGGVGKSSLALAAGAELLDRFRGGVWWVPLATNARAREVLPTVAACVHADPTGRLPVLDALTARFETAPTLLILDNMEHLLDAAGQLPPLLDRVPTLRVLVTSLTQLHIPAEHVFSLSTLEEEAAIELLVRSGRRVLPDLQLDDSGLAAARDVCVRLDRLPLAIELVAARLSVLNADEIAAQLGESFDLVSGTRRGDLPRHESLAATIAWTLDNLDAGARALFAV
jgi:class 3 adenylate cyclase